MFPSPSMPANKVCIVDLFDVDEDLVMRNKKCVLNYHNIDDPWDVDGNGIFKYAQTQVTNEALIVVDDYCIVAGTDTNYPEVNQFELAPEDVPDFKEVSDTRFMVVCFVEPIFNPDMLQDLMQPKPAEAPEMNQDPTVSKSGATEAASAGCVPNAFQPTVWAFVAAALHWMW